MIGIPEKKYDIIYADPPWRYEHPISTSRKIENQYPTMELEDIKNMHVPSADDCILYIWATAPKLEEAIEVNNAWGFSYRSCMVWDKTHIGMGYWFRNQHELLLVGTKGKVHPPNATKRISSILKKKNRKHSEKPKEIRAYIQLWYPDLLKIELFGRDKIEGWDVWGNQIPKTTQMILK